MDSVPPRDWYEERPGRWIAEQDWPSPDHAPMRLQLGDGSTLAADAAPLAPRSIASPQDCGMAGGEYCAIWLGPELPGDQRADDAKSVCFDSAPLDAAARHRRRAGDPAALSADRPQRHDRGAAVRRAAGRRLDPHHLRRAQPHATATATNSRSTSCRAKSMEIALPARRHRLPRAGRAPAARRHLLDLLADGLAVARAGDADARTTARIDLPVRPSGNGDEGRFAEPGRRHALGRSRRSRAGSNSRKVDRDERTGIVTLAIVDDFGEVRDLEHGLVNGGVARETLDHRSGRSAVGARRDALDADLVARWMVGAHRNLRPKCARDATNFHLTRPNRGL